MTIEGNGKVFGMQNPGDLRVPEGVVVKAAHNVYIKAPGEELAERKGYDDVVDLSGNGVEFSNEDEQAVLDETTFRSGI